MGASAEANCHAATSRYANSGITGLSPPTSTKTERMANGEGNVHQRAVLVDEASLD